MTLTVGLCGIRGYVGQILAKLIMQHPNLALTNLYARKPHDDLLTEQCLAQGATWQDSVSIGQSDNDILFLATPADASVALMEHLTAFPGVVIDMSGAFRLNAADYEPWYGFTHSLPRELSNFVYGLSPWWQQTSKDTLTRIANPGCYATCALMSLIPLLKEKIIHPDNIIIDAKSGASGAGRAAKDHLQFGEVHDNFYAYRIGQHQHTPEIKRFLALFAGERCDIQLTTSLLPIHRGLTATIYAQACQDDETTRQAIHAAYEKAYADYPFFQACDLISEPARGQALAMISACAHTANTHVSYFVKNNRIILSATIDNLLKGAASQAIESVNSLFGFKPATGLVMGEMS